MSLWCKALSTALALMIPTSGPISVHLEYNLDSVTTSICEWKHYIITHPCTHIYNTLIQQSTKEIKGVYVHVATHTTHNTYMYICMYTHTHTHTHTHTMYICMYTHACAHTHACTHTHLVGNQLVITPSAATGTGSNTDQS